MASSSAPPATERLLAWTLTALAFTLPVSIAGTNIALGLLTAALLAHLASGERLDWRQAHIPAVWLLCLFCAVAAITSFTGVLPSRSLHHIYKDLHKLWVLWALLLALRAAPPRHAPAAMAAGFIFVSSYGVARTSIENYDDVLAAGFTVGWDRVHAFVDAVTFGEMAALGLIGALSFLARGPAGSRRPLWIYTALLAAALLLNQTRGAILGVLVGFAAMCAAKPSLRRWLKWLLAAAALGAFVASLRKYSAMHFTRLTLWDVAWRIFQDHPWLGVGPSNYATVFTGYFHDLLEERAVWGSAHNIYLQHLAERGLVGLAVLLALFWTLLTRAWENARLSAGPASLLALGATAAFLAMNLTESAFQNEQITTLFLALWAYTESQAGART